MCLQDESYSCFASRQFDIIFNTRTIYALLEIIFVLLSGQTFAIHDVKIAHIHVHYYTYPLYRDCFEHMISVLHTTIHLFALQALCAVSLGSCCALALRAIC